MGTQRFARSGGGVLVLVAALTSFATGVRSGTAVHGRIGQIEAVAVISRSADASAAAVPGTIVQLIPLPQPPATAPPVTAPPVAGPTTTAPRPANPGDTKNCPDFATYAEAKQWFDLYFPYYGDVAKLDADHDGIPCETLPGAPA